MLLRRVTEHVRAQSWTAIFIDLVIVVIGVYLGLQVQEWSNARSDRQRESQILTDMLADLDIDREQYANGMGLALRRIGAANASLKGAGLAPIDFEWQMPSTDLVAYSLDEQAIDNVPVERHDRLWTDVVMGYFPVLSTAAFDSMVGAGDTNIIGDRDLVRAIQVYQALVASVENQNDKLLGIRENALTVGASYGLAPYATMAADEYFRLVASEQELAATIRLQATFAIFHHGEMASADSRAAKLQERLKQYLSNL